MSAFLELIRIRQWIKNGFVLAPLFFGKDLFHRAAVLHALTALLAFCLASSAVYIFNDWRDIEADRRHAVKKARPLASERIGVPAAMAAMVLFLGAAAAVIFMGGLPPAFWVIIALYLTLNLGYSLGLKQVTIVELLLVSSGFVLRLLAGGVALAIPLSPWIVIATGTVALLITTGKRRGDIAQKNDAANARRSLAGYNLPYLDGVLAALTGSTFVVFLLFCASDYAVGRYGPYILITAVPVAAGLMRYLQLIIVYGDGDSPSDLVMRDKGLLTAVMIFIAAFGVLLYLR